MLQIHIYIYSGDVDSLEEETFLEDAGKWKSEKEKDLATCFGFDVR